MNVDAKRRGAVVSKSTFSDPGQMRTGLFAEGVEFVGSGIADKQAFAVEAGSAWQKKGLLNTSRPQNAGPRVEEEERSGEIEFIKPIFQKDDSRRKVN